eukprot:gb/GECG01008987.1/.p1 GENE.gb/GECG01008987.1/~~gb/GECG01008987.1/.p1  ORF type:complete len:297 (+),score=34.31 gb/GECG01008987.1/:1-891(+)
MQKHCHADNNSLETHSTQIIPNTIESTTSGNELPVFQANPLATQTRDKTATNRSTLVNGNQAPELELNAIDPLGKKNPEREISEPIGCPKRPTGKFAFAGEKARSTRKMNETHRSGKKLFQNLHTTSTPATSSSSGAAQHSRPSVEFVDPRSHSVSHENVRIVSAIKPNLRRVEKRNSVSNQTTKKVASIFDVDTTSMGRGNRAWLQLRKWKATLLAEPPPLLEIELESSSKDEVASDSSLTMQNPTITATRLDFAKRNMHNSRSSEVTNKRIPRREFDYVSKKEFSPVLPSASRP